MDNVLHNSRMTHIYSRFLFLDTSQDDKFCGSICHSLEFLPLLVKTTKGQKEVRSRKSWHYGSEAQNKTKEEFTIDATAMTMDQSKEEVLQCLDVCCDNPSSARPAITAATSCEELQGALNFFKDSQPRAGNPLNTSSTWCVRCRHQ